MTRGAPPAYIVGSFDLYALVARARVARPGDVVLSTRLNMVVRDGRLIELTPMRFRLALALMGSTPMSREDLIETMWCDSPDGGPEFADRTLRTHFNALRHWLGRLGLRIVRPHAGHYMIEADSPDLAAAAAE